MDILIACVLQIIFIIICIGAGRFITDRSLNFGSENLYLRVGSYFFIGTEFIIIFTRITAYFSKNASLSSWCAIIIATLFLFLSYSQIKIDIINFFKKIKKVIAFSAPLLVVALMLLMYWLPPGNLGQDPFASVGSLHSTRYAWIVNSIYETNSILIFPQNTAQSILAFIVSTASFQAPYLYLYLWLISSLFFLSIFIYGLLCKLSGNTSNALLGLAVFMMGNSALSITHVLIIDSGSPFLLNGYTDSILGIFSIFFLLIINENIKEKIPNYKFFLLTLIITICNFFCAPQNVILIALFPLSSFIFCKFKNKPNWHQIFFWFLILLVSATISIPEGGMLTPKSLLSDIDYPGIMTVAGRGIHSRLTISPGVPYHYGWLGNWVFGHNSIEFAKEYLSSGVGLGNFVNKIIWTLEQIFITSIRVNFFVIIGIIYLINKFNSPKNIINNHKGLLTLNSVGYYGMVFFVAGFTGCFLFSLNGYKWELSRFLIPGVSIGMLGLSLAVMHLNKNDFLYRKYIIGLILILILGGPTVNFIGTSAYNALLLIKHGDYKSYIAEFIGRGPVITKF